MSGVQRRMRAIIGLGVGLALGLAGGAAAQEVGRVVSLAGEARAEGPGGTRALACGDSVRAGERVVVAPNGRVGVLSDAVFAQLDGASRLRAGVTEQGLPDWTLEKGRVRVVDTRGAEPGAGRLRLGTPHAEARGLNSDSEAYVLSEKAGAYSIVCEWGEPIPVARNDETLLAAPGQCAIAKPGEALFASAAHEERIPIAGDDCVGAPLIGAVAARFDPTDVAAPPPPGSLLPPAPPTFGRQPCDNPGSGCTGGGFGSAVIPDGGIGVFEPPTTPPGSLPSSP